MSVDWHRFRELEQQAGENQFGQALQIAPGPGAPDLVLASKDLIRFNATKVDVTPLRVYLGPWQPRNGIPIAPAPVVTATYVDPTPWAPPEPRVFDSMADIPFYARVMWGSGMVQHTAFVDWPKRGLLLQLSGSYLQVNAFVDTTSPAINPLVLPLVQATMAPEPGGGDSVQPATFTYRPSIGTNFGPGPAFEQFWNFQVPPFARAFALVMPLTTIRTAALTINVAEQVFPDIIGASAGNDVQWWQLPDPVDGYPAFDLTTQAQPIAGQNVGVIRVEMGPGASIPLVPPRIGCMFYLDL